MCHVPITCNFFWFSPKKWLDFILIFSRLGHLALGFETPKHTAPLKANYSHILISLSVCCIIFEVRSQLVLEQIPNMKIHLFLQI